MGQGQGAEEGGRGPGQGALGMSAGEWGRRQELTAGTTGELGKSRAQAYGHWKPPSSLQDLKVREPSGPQACPALPPLVQGEGSSLLPAVR